MCFGGCSEAFEENRQFVILLTQRDKFEVKCVLVPVYIGVKDCVGTGNKPLFGIKRGHWPDRVLQKINKL